MIKEISIRNFGIFKGLHKIVLSTDATTPVTVISTITASGKTTLIDAVCWCLYGKSSMKADAIFNCERQQELKTGEIDSVDVELIYSEPQNFQRVYRSIAFKKAGDRIFRCPEYDSCSVENHNLFPVETIAQTLFLGELLHSPRFEAVIEEIGANYLRRHRIRNHEKLNALFNVIMERIAASASCAFKELNFRHGTYNIVWNGKFSMYRSDNNMLVNELSETDRLVFNIAILHGARDVLFERKALHCFQYLLMIYSCVQTKISFLLIN